MKVEFNEHIERNWTQIVYSGLLRSNMRQWFDCLEGDYAIWGVEGFIILDIYFEKPSDAALFKLTWK